MAENKLAGKAGIKAPKKREKKTVLTDLSIQGTNDSSIVSKRSVERLYWKKQNTGEFLKFFVAKPIRRSPVINRGYWTRVRALKHIIDTCLKRNRDSSKHLVVVNLGCGFDPYPFQYLHTSPEESNITFVDVDYPDLMKRKVAIIQKHQEFHNVIGEFKVFDGLAEQLSEPETISGSEKPAKKHENPLILTSSQYIALSCDLRDLDTFSSTLNGLFPFANNSFLFTAEVSLTYMDNKSADDLIQWAGTLPDSDFALLEQLVPAGPDHPFAKTMLKHFNHLGTPLHSVLKYPSKDDQRMRFKSRGWKSVGVENLYEFWKNHVTPEEKDFVSSVEDFDELEEFIIFCQHYFILHASTRLDSTLGVSYTPSPDLSSLGFPIKMRSTKAATSTQRRFAAGCIGQNLDAIYHGGLHTTRLNSLGAISALSNHVLTETHTNSVQPRMCHTFTNIDNDSQLLVAGRLNPGKPLSDCWIFEHSKWTEVQPLPLPRYRHSTVAIGHGKVLVYGGCTTNEESSFLLWDRETGWIYLKSNLESRSSAALVWDSKHNIGYLIGGKGSGHGIERDCISIEIDGDEVVAKKIIEHDFLERYGAKCILEDDGQLLVAGGVSGMFLYTRDSFFAKLDVTSKAVTLHSVALDEDARGPDMPMPVGFNLEKLQGNYLIYNGGAVCFSFGSFWNDNYEVLVNESAHELKTLEPQQPEKAVAVYPTEIKEMEMNDRGSFDSETSKGLPFLMVNNSLGNTMAWNSPDHLIKLVGAERKVIVHVSQDRDLSFQAKNFKYETMSFSDFISLMFKDGSNVYLRSVSNENPRQKPAMFLEDFPALFNEFKLPSHLNHIQETHFSSPLRMSSQNTSIWLHYDVTANILCQVTGKKRVRMYPPSDVEYLSFPAGSSSSTISNIFEASVDPRCHPIEFTMSPGDILYIPAMWLHAMKPLSPSISVNFFYKDLTPEKYAAGRDVYGNRDLAAYETGRKTISNLISSLEDLPEEIRRFYLLRLADELKDAARH